MMRRFIYAIIISLVGVGLANAQDLTSEAKTAYEKDEFDKAISLYEEIAKTQGTSSDLFYNLGNSHYRLGHMGQAILNYERALKLDPNNEDAKANLEFVKDKINIKDAEGDSYFADAFMGWVKGRSSNSWAVIAVVLFLTFIAALLVYIFVDNIMLRKIGFFGGGVVLVLFVLTLVFAFVSRNETKSKNHAIVTVPSTTLSTSPRVPKDKTEEAFLLNEGYKVEIVDSVKPNESESDLIWYNVIVNNRDKAWVKSGDIEII